MKAVIEIHETAEGVRFKVRFPTGLDMNAPAPKCIQVALEMIQSATAGMDVTDSKAVIRRRRARK